MNITIYIPSYQSHDYFYQMLNNFLSYEKHDTRIRVYVTKPLDKERVINPKDNLVTFYQFNPDIKCDLVHQYYNHVIEDNGKYELYIYCEDDILIPEKVIDTFLEENKKLPDDAVIGLLRYELYNGSKHLDEFHPHSNSHSIEPQMRQINGRWYFTTENVHQACWTLEQRNLNKVLVDGKFIFDWGDTLEDAASNPYKSNKWPGKPNSLDKLWPVDNLDNLLIHHLSNRYAQTDQRFLTIEQLNEKAKSAIPK
jgi:hypothetical protein